MISRTFRYHNETVENFKSKRKRSDENDAQQFMTDLSYRTSSRKLAPLTL